MLNHALHGLRHRVWTNVILSGPEHCCCSPCSSGNRVQGMDNVRAAKGVGCSKMMDSFTFIGPSSTVAGGVKLKKAALFVNCFTIMLRSAL